MKNMAKKTENFEIKKVNMETLPEYLRATRESFYYDLKDAAHKLNMSERFLDALEKGYYHKLPADVYVLGFLKRIGELYRVDPDVLIEQYRKERNIHDSINKPRPNIKSYDPEAVTLNPKTMGIGILGLFILFVLGYLAFQVQAINRPPDLRITDPADGSHIKTSSLIIQGHTDAGTKLTIEGENNNIFVDSEGNFKALIGIAPGEKILNFVATNNFGKQTTKQLLIIGDFVAKDKGTPVENTLTLEIQIGPNSTPISLKIDNNLQKDETILAGSSRTYTAKDRIVLSTGDAGSTRVILNGKDLGKLGREGEVLRDIVFSADTINLK